MEKRQRAAALQRSRVANTLTGWLVPKYSESYKFDKRNL
jgi:hypothetical protein